MERTQEQQGRWASVGKLAGALAHEIKNPLSTIALNLALLREQWEEQAGNRAERTVRKIDVLTREVDRLQVILDDFLRYAREPVLERVEVDVAALLRDLAEFSEAELRRQGTALRLDLPAEGLGVIDADIGLLRQALLNVLVNARHACSDGGEIMVAGRLAEGTVVLEVTDTGTGMDEETAMRCFDPYFSTKGGSGTGLGLSMTRKIIEDHGGSVAVHSEPRVGTRFTLTVPGEARA